MNNRLIHFILTVVTLAAGQAQDLRTRKSAPEMIRHTDNTTTVEHGLKGSRQRKAARTFSGEIEMPMFAADARKGSPAEMQSQTTEAGSDATVAISNPRFATFEATEGVETARVSAKATAHVTGTFFKDPRAQMTSPTDGSTLSATTRFEWSAGASVSGYWLWIGSCFECNDLLDEDQGGNLSRTLRLPADGRVIYVTLFSFISGDWYWMDYSYTGSRNEPVFAHMTSPDKGSTLNRSQTFTWDTGYLIDEIWLRIGSCEGCKDILDESQGLHTYRTVNLPTDGRTIYVQLFSRVNRDWWYYDYQYRAYKETTTSCKARVDVTNQLAYSVNISVNSNVVGSVPAYQTAGVNTEVCSLSVSFSVNQPTLSGRTLGDAMSGVFSTITNPSGNYTFTVSNKIGSSYFFAPLITNKTTQALLIEVNGGLQSQNRCNCTAAAGGTRVATGYYKLFSNSNVRLWRSNSGYTGPYRYFGTDANGSVAPGGILSNFVSSPSGTTELTITTAP